MSDESADLEQRLTSFFRDVLVPLAEISRRSGVEFFPLGPETSSVSYYSECSEKRTYLHSIDLSNLEKQLQKMWEGGDFPELASIAGELSEFSQLLKEKESEKGEISPFIYAMF